MLLRFLAVSLLALGGTRAAHAEPPPVHGQPPAPPPPAEAQGSSWYGWQTGFVSGGSDALLIYGIARERDEAKSGQALIYLGTLGYVLGSPIIHFVHGGRARATTAVQVDVGLAAAGALGGLIYGASGRHAHGAGYYAVNGIEIGMVVATVVDAALLSWDPAEPAKPAAHVAPVLCVGSGGAVLGVAATL